MTTKKDIAKKQAEIVGQLQQFPIGRTNSGGRAGGTVEVVVTNPLPGQPRVVQAKCANDCAPGDVQLLKVDDGSYVALSPTAAVKTSETTTRQVSKKESVKPKKDEEIWPCTVAFLYSRIKPNIENLTNNGAATDDETSWDWDGENCYSSPEPGSYAYAFRQRFDTLGDYATAQDALDNKLKPDRLITPTGTGSGAGKDNAAANSSSADAITIWFYLGNPSDVLSNGRIVKISGPPLHPSADNVVDDGPGFCLEVFRGSIFGSAIFPNEIMGLGPLTKYLKRSFPELGGLIGYAGRIERWRGMQDYSSTIPISYFRDIPSGSSQSPTDFPDWHVPGAFNPWNYTDNTWFQFGWPDPQYTGCASSAWINIELSALNATTACGEAIDNEEWFWGGDAAPYRGVLDKNNPGGFIGVNGMFVCWRGHKDHAGMAQAYFEAFRVYWGITGTVTKLGSANFYGCELPDGSGGYPPAPPAEASRFIAESYGRKAEIWLKIHKEDMPPYELKLPFEFAAIVQSTRILGGGSFATGSDFEDQKVIHRLRTHGLREASTDRNDPYSVECPHSTLSLDGEFAYIDILYGCERNFEEPLVLPIRSRLANMGFGSPRTGTGLNYGLDYLKQRLPGANPSGAFSNSDIKISGDIRSAETDTHPRVVKDTFTNCQSYVVKLPTKDEPVATIVAANNYKQGESITLTAANPDNEFNNKFLIADFRTDNYITGNNIPIGKTIPQSYHAGFGGLPALTQLIDYTPDNVDELEPVFYKNQNEWTEMDWLHHQLQEAPKQYNPQITVLPPNVFTSPQATYATIFDLDTKFDRHGRAEQIMPASAFGYTNSISSSYSVYQTTAYYPLFISFKEQLIGNGLKKNNKLFKWFRVSTSSFPIFGQLKRNPQSL